MSGGLGHGSSRGPGVRTSRAGTAGETSCQCWPVLNSLYAVSASGSSAGRRAGNVARSGWGTAACGLVELVLRQGLGRVRRRTGERHAGLLKCPADDLGTQRPAWPGADASRPRPPLHRGRHATHQRPPGQRARQGVVAKVGPFVGRDPVGCTVHAQEGGERQALISTGPTKHHGVRPPRTLPKGVVDHVRVRLEAEACSQVGLSEGTAGPQTRLGVSEGVGGARLGRRGVRRWRRWAGWAAAACAWRRA